MLTTATLSYGGATLDLVSGDYGIESWKLPRCPYTTAYVKHLAAGGDPRSFIGDVVGETPLGFTVVIKGSGTLLALSALWQQGAILTWAEDSATAKWCELTAPSLKSRAAGGFIKSECSATRHYAYDAGVTYAAQTVPCVGTVDFPGVDESAVPGDPDVPALTTLKATFAQAVTGAALGLWPEPASGYDPLDDYLGAADANALGDAESANSASLTATPATIATPPNISTADNRGPHYVFARIENTATAHTTVSFRAWSSVTGAAMARSTTVYGDPVAATLDNGQGFEVTALGIMDVPAGAVPDVETGSGWTAESSLAENTVDDGTLTLTSASSGTSQTLMVHQTFASFAGQITAIEYTVDAEASSTLSSNKSIKVYNASNVLQLTHQLQDSDLTAGTHKIELLTPVAVSASETWSFKIQLVAASAFTIGFAYSNGDYAAGALTTPDYGSGESAGDDLTFKVYGQTELGFNSAIGVQAADTAAASKVAQIDFAIRVPTAYGAVIWTPASATTAAEGIYIANNAHLEKDRNIFWADADGIGPSVLSTVRRFGSIMFWPGVTNRVVSVAHTPAAAKPGNGTYLATVVGRYAALGSETNQ